MIKNIVIVGGGTAGWSTAHHFINKTSPDTKITVVAAKEIPIIGVGESTTGRYYDLINLEPNMTGVNEKDFLKETESTFKIGIKHSDWHTIGKSFYSPIGDGYTNPTKFPHKDYDNLRIYHVAEDLDYDKFYQSQLMAHNRLHIINGQNVFKDEEDKPIAYHLDTYKVGQYLKRKAIDVRNKCKYIDGKVIDFKQDKDGFVKHLILKDGRKIKGDLFIDCTGFARLLISKVEDNKWISYKDNLLVDSALNFNYEHDENEPIKNYTHAWAQKNGWCWEIPTQTRMGCGYVFSSQHTDFGKAHDEISKKLKHRKIKVQREIKFNTGRLSKFWCKNVLSTGLSSAFIEPLEATSIHATIIQITHFIENYFTKNLNLKNNLFQNQYNNEMTTMWDNIRDFIIFHYITPRKDSKFWKESSSKERWSPRLKKIMSMWKDRMPRIVDYIDDKNNNFYNIGNTLYYQIAIGMKLLDRKIAKKELKDYGIYDISKKMYEEIKEHVKINIHKSIKTNEYYKTL